MQIIAIIPARSGSQRVPGKNIRPLGGKPLMQWTIETAIRCPLISATYLSSDSEDYIKMGAAWGVAGILRHPNLAVASATDLPVIQHAISQLSLSPDDLILYLRPTTPFRNVNVLGAMIGVFTGYLGEYTGLRSVEEMGESCFKCFVMDTDRKLLGLGDTDLPNQMVPVTYRANGYGDICKVSEVTEGWLWGDRVMGYETPRTVEIDTEEDWRYAEYLVREGLCL